MRIISDDNTVYKLRVETPRYFIYGNVQQTTHSPASNCFRYERPMTMVARTLVVWLRTAPPAFGGLLLLLVVLLLAQGRLDVGVSAMSRHMIAIRPPSRNTYGFFDSQRYHDYHNNYAPLVDAINDIVPYDLPLLELQSLLSTTITSLPPLRPLFEPVDSSGTLFWMNTTTKSTKDDLLALAVSSRAILTHAAYEIFVTCESLHPLVAAEANQVGCPLTMSTLTTQVHDMTNPNMSKQQRASILTRAGVNCDDHDDTTASTTRRPPVVVLILREDGHVHVGYKIATGPAAVGTTGAPGKSPRRNYKGVLGTFALKHRIASADPAAISTAMEPEIAFLMASLANIQIGSKVLDPCCGSASLLLSAAAWGATTVVGVDQDASTYAQATQEFQRLIARGGLPPGVVHTLYQGDVLQPQLTRALEESDSYDAIVCDPPYNIGAPVLVNGRDSRPSNYHIEDEAVLLDCSSSPETQTQTQSRLDLTAAVLGVAAKTLKVGGRLVFFVPVRGEKEAKRSLQEVLRTHGYECEDERLVSDNDSVPNTATSNTATSRLRIVHGRLQRFSPTFSRWLVTMEKVSDSE